MLNPEREDAQTLQSSLRTFWATSLTDQNNPARFEPWLPIVSCRAKAQPSRCDNVATYAGTDRLHCTRRAWLSDETLGGPPPPP
jgi:hypothetical protein